MDAEDLLYLLYTSRDDRPKPKGIVHTTGGYLVGTSRRRTSYVFDLKPDEDVYWCTADIGWVTGHSYVVYGPLANGATAVLYEGAPDFPDKDRFWEIIERYGVTILYTAPTAIRTFMKWGTEFAGAARPVVAAPARNGRRADQPGGLDLVPRAHRRRALPGRRHVVADRDGRDHDQRRCPGSRPRSRVGHASRSPAIAADIVNEQGESVAVPGGGGYLVLTRPWPSMLRGIYGDPERYLDTYWIELEGRGLLHRRRRQARRRRLFLAARPRRRRHATSPGTASRPIEVESALVDHPASPRPPSSDRTDAITGQAIAAFVTLQGRRARPRASSSSELRDHVAKKIGAIARPATSCSRPSCPKTRSGKIMRRLLRDVAEGQALGDTTTLADPTVVEGIKSRYLAAQAAAGDEE